MPTEKPNKNSTTNVRRYTLYSLLYRQKQFFFLSLGIRSFARPIQHNIKITKAAGAH